MNRPDHDRFRRLTDLFDELVALDPSAREAALEARCEGDPDLARDLRVMLAADDTGSGDRLMREVVGEVARDLSQTDAVGRRLGPWSIVRTLGEGGMGTVYLAERADGAYEASAAVKLVRGGIPSPLLDARLRRERQILAGLSHPGIARLLDGGSTSDGTPYLVMEFVQGTPITEWCRERDIPVEETLRLVLKVCDAVAYAHGALVVHRDLKPSNILVTGEGEPKLLDFGIARLVESVEEEAEGAAPTQGWRLLTPGYASPEQLRGERVGVPSDVYSLGVLLYRLLAGQLPLDVSGMGPGEAIQTVSTQVPPLLSSAAEPDTRRRLQGDLDAIVSRALRKEPRERYPSVAALAEDLRRHLEGRPITVRRDDWQYRTGKFLRRNAGAVSTAALVIILLVSFTLSSVVQARTLRVERDRSEARRATAERVTSFLEELFTQADPNESPSQVSARELLDRGAQRIFAEMGDEPEVQAALATVMGRVYRNLGEYGAAAPLLDSAVALRERASPTPAELSESLLEAASLAYDNGEYQASLEILDRALEVRRSRVAGDDGEVARILDWMAANHVQLGNLDQAEPLTREYLAMSRRLYDEPDDDVATALINLADLLRDRGEFVEAEALGREALEQRRALFGDVHLDVAHALNQLASTLNRAGRPAEAVPLVEEGLAIRETIFPGGHPETAASLGNLANILGGLERFEEAEAARRRSLEMLATIFGPEHPYVAATTFSLGDLLFRMGRMEDATETLEESLRLHRVTLPEGHPNLGYPLTTLGRLHLARGEPARAEPYLREAYTARREGLGPEHWHVAASGLELGRALEAQGRREEARPLLEESHRILEATFGADDSRTAQARDALAALEETGEAGTGGG